MAKWLLDPGHGGTDPGACYKGRRESDDVLKLSKRVGEILKSNGETVKYTRTSDATVSLSQRSSMENKGSYDYFVSIHRNAVGPEVAKGVETHIYSKGGKSEQLANIVNPLLVSVGFVDRKVKVSNFHVLRETKCASILIEVGFIDHTTDNKLFDSKFEQIAQAIAKGCLQQIGKSLSTSQPSTPSTSGEMYRVRKSWSDASSQIGAYSVLKNAKALCDKNPGYKVFNSAGTQVYPAVSTSYTVRITADVLNVRKGPGTSYAVATTVKQNEVYTIVEEQNGWGKLKSGAGWISLDYTVKC